MGLAVLLRFDSWQQMPQIVEEEKEESDLVDRADQTQHGASQIIRPLIYEIALSTSIPDKARRSATVIAVGLTCFSLAIELESLLLIVNERDRSASSFGIPALESLNSAVNFGLHGSMGIPFVK